MESVKSEEEIQRQVFEKMYKDNVDFGLYPGQWETTLLSGSRRVKYSDLCFQNTNCYVENLNKANHVSLLTKSYTVVKAMVFRVVIYRRDSSTIKKAEY